MKYTKMLLLAVAIGALSAMAGGGTAAATTVTSPESTTLGVGAELKAEGGGAHATLDTTSGSITCESTTMVGKIKNAGSFMSATVSGEFTNLTFAKCNCPVTVLRRGSFEIHHATGTDGTVTTSGIELTTECFGLHCIWSTNNTDFGTLFGAGRAVLTAGFSIPRTGGRSGIFCGSTGTWTGTYSFTAPNEGALFVDP